ncbi:TPA: hypothetical protein QCI25_002593 [Enterobacter ludwigii]|nr:hypothetical protein [Enterobacter ludwigii]
MSVKRFGYGYELDGNSGPFVKYDDYAALEARCAALAAENAGLKALARGWANATDDRLFEEHGEIFHDSIDACEEELKTTCPTTDTFLADVMAQGVERLANAWYAIANETDPGISISDSSRLKYRQRADDAADFANEIRQEAAQ